MTRGSGGGLDGGTRNGWVGVSWSSIHAMTLTVPPQRLQVFSIVGLTNAQGRRSQLPLLIIGARTRLLFAPKPVAQINPKSMQAL